MSGAGPDQTQTPKPQSRACDRCKRRKQRCIYADGSACRNCENAGERCDFQVPPAKRGPKSRRSRNNHQATTRNISTESPGPGHQSLSETPQSAGSRYSITSPARPAFSVNSPANEATATSSWHNDISLATSEGAIHVASVLQRWANLATAIRSRLTSSDLETVSRRCFDLFFEYIFPLTPLADEDSLRDALELFIEGFVMPQAPSEMDIDASAQASPGSSLQQPQLTPERRMVNPTRARFPKLWLDSTFTWITAVCAEAAFFLPKEIFPEGALVAETFLQASRDGLQSYFETDLEHPSASSVAIRYFHSNCLHAMGKQRYSWHMFGEATRLVQAMHLHDEASYDSLPPTEAELRRRAFWLVYMGDKSAALLNNRPITMHKFSFQTGISANYPSGGGHEFIVGFNANLRLWETASDLLLELRLLRDRATDQQPSLSSPFPVPPRHVTDEDRARLDHLHIRFATCLDDLPLRLLPYSLHRLIGGPIPAARNPETEADPSHSAQNQTHCAIQIANLHVSFHCLKMITFQRLEEAGFDCLGYGIELGKDPDVRTNSANQVLRKTEIARGLLRVICEVPFWSLQVNGEPNVEKIRLVGASLLAVVHQYEGSPLAARARRDFTVLLDILTRLDSKASDALREGFS